ncbi:MAG TPA: DUF3857 domain-containing transglutaminase family protein [Gemmatimonadales bacterium]|nr:DUF3857 domain-containing transglutaminase family protein [Gemmatimonadales bacterium]
MNALLILLLAQSAQLTRDSIYALRVDPKAHPGQDYVLLLEEGSAKLETDGRSSYTLRQVAQVLTTDGAEWWGELALSYVPPRQKIRINWIRVIGADGSVVREGAEHQEETTPTVDQGAPIYSDRRTIQATLGGVAPGTLVDFSYTLETVSPHLPGDFFYHWAFNGSQPVRRSRFTLDTPVELRVPVVEHNLSAPAQEQVADGRRRRTWAARELPEIEWERYAGSPNKVVQSVSVGGAVSWPDVGTWYRQFLVDRFTLTPEIVAAHAAQLKGAKTQDDSVRATYRWVAQDFRYVSLSLGDGGYLPRTPAEVFRTRFGDCKDKTVLFVSLLRRMGLTAYPVLVNSSGPVDSLFPGVKQFDHMIAAVVRRGKVEYADVTPSLVPYGELPTDLHGEAGLALPESGARVVVMPAAPPERNRYDREVVGALGLDGRFVGRITLTASGTEQTSLRNAFSNIDQQDAKDRDERLREYAHAVYENATVDSVRYFEGRDLQATPTVTVWLTAKNVIGRVGTRYYFNVPLLKFANEDAISTLDAEGRRDFPIDIAQVNSPSVWRSSVEIELPEGWKAEVPGNVSTKGAFGYYNGTYRQVGRMFRASREMGGQRGLLPPDSVKALRAWFSAINEDKREMIVLQHGAGAPLLDVSDADSVPGSLGKLPLILLTEQDFPAGVRVSAEGEPGESGFASLASRDPIESYQRSFASEQMVFKTGESRLIMLQATAGAFRTSAEAERNVRLLELLDLAEFFKVYLSELGLQETSLKNSRPVDLKGIGDHASGSIFELATPVATFDLAMVMAVRDRVSFMLIAVGPQSVSGGDLANLLRTMDQRLREHPGYATEVTGGPAEADDTEKADSAMRANTKIRLDEIVARPAGLDSGASADATFTLNNGWPQYVRNLEGLGLTFPLHGANAVSIRMDAMLHDTEAQALKRVLYAETGDREYIFGSMLSGMGKIVEHLADDDSSTLQPVPATGLGAGTRSYEVSARLRSILHLDVDMYFLSSGRLSSVIAVQQMPGSGTTGAAAQLARSIEGRMSSALPRASSSAPSPRLIQEIRRVIQAERAVDSLVEARQFEAVFAAIERARLNRAPVGFWTRTWNRVCWWGSLGGFAQRAQTACDSAVAVDTTDVSTRDSRGLGRALAGNLKGATSDFAYVVEHSEAGAFLDKRAAWLEALRAGRNPFTPQVLDELRKQ